MNRLTEILAKLEEIDTIWQKQGPDEAAQALDEAIAYYRSAVEAEEVQTCLARLKNSDSCD